MAYKKLKYWFDKELAELLADKLLVVDPEFGKRRFIKNIQKRVEGLELKDRVEVFADLLYCEWRDYSRGIENLSQILGPENEDETGMFKQYYWLMPVAKYVEKYGLNDFEVSMKMIEEITKRNTGEYAIRPFLVKDTEQALLQMVKWASSENSHVRRLSSEGARPRLPWAKKLELFIENPALILPIYELLKDDPSKYVQKSVANAINDILKDNYEVGRELLEKWCLESGSMERNWIIKHALRNQLKINNPWAVELMNKLKK